MGGLRFIHALQHMSDLATWVIISVKVQDMALEITNNGYKTNMLFLIFVVVKGIAKRSAPAVGLHKLSFKMTTPFE